MLPVPPFVAICHRTSDRDWFNFALVAEAPKPAQVAPAVAELRRLFAERDRKLKIEFNEAVWPELAPELEAAGLRLRERNPLMACTARDLRPLRAEGVVVRLLRRNEPEPVLAAFQSIRFGRPVESALVEELRVNLRRGRGSYALAAVGAEPAGTAVLHALEGTGEVVGVATRPEFRRRGVAAAATSFLCERHFRGGGRLVFLDSANEEASRVYERLGFQRFGALLVYV